MNFIFPSQEIHFNEDLSWIPSCTQATLQRLNPTSDFQPLLLHCDFLNSLSRDWSYIPPREPSAESKQHWTPQNVLQWWGDNEGTRKKHGEWSGWFQTDHFIVSVQTRTSTAAEGSQTREGYSICGQTGSDSVGIKQKLLSHNNSNYRGYITSTTTHHSDSVSDGLCRQVAGELCPDHPAVAVSPGHLPPDHSGLVWFTAWCHCVPAEDTTHPGLVQLL